MSERAPGGFGQFDRETIAAQAALHAAQEEQLIQDAAAAARIEQVSPVDQEGNLKDWNLNDLAHLQAFGSQGREYVDPHTGQKIADEEHVLPGMVDRIRSDELFGKTPEERDKVAKDYSDTLHGFVEKGFETTQAKLLADGALTDSYIGIPKLTKQLIAAGEKPLSAKFRAESLFNERAKRRIDTVSKHAFMTTEQYQTSQEARKDSLELNQEGLVTQLRLADRYAQNQQTAKLMHEADRRGETLTLEEAQRQAAKLYSDKYNRQLKTIYENGLDSRKAYDDFLKRKARGNTAPKPDDTETREIPRVEEAGGKLAPEIDLHDLDSRGLRFARLLALSNENGGKLPKAQQDELDSLRSDLNGAYKPAAQRTPAELDKSAKRLGITRAKLLERLGNFEDEKTKLKEKGMFTSEDRLPLTGDKLYRMFAADSPDARVYVGEGGITLQMADLLDELAKNKGTGASLFKMVNGKPQLTAHPSSAGRGRRIKKMVKEINENRQVPLYWLEQKDVEGNPQIVGPDPESEETKGVGDILLEQFMGNREVSTSTRRKRAAQWMKGKLPFLGRESEASAEEQKRLGRFKRLGGAVARATGFGPLDTRIELSGDKSTPEQKAYWAARQAEIDAGRAGRSPGNPEGGATT